MRIIRIVPACITFMVLLLIAASAYGLPRLDDERPAVPHPIVNQLDCLGCHGAGEDFAEDHQGQTHETCTT